MGKNRVIESLIRLIANVVVHEIILENTNRPESAHFLNSEVIEYRSQTGAVAREFNWNDEDREYVEREALKKIKDKLSIKYSDVKYSEQKLARKLKEMIKDVM